MRNALSQLQLLAGKTDYSNHQEVEQFYKLGDDVFEILTIHAADENEVTLAELELRYAGCKTDPGRRMKYSELNKEVPYIVLSVVKIIIGILVLTENRRIVSLIEKKEQNRIVNGKPE